MSQKISSTVKLSVIVNSDELARQVDKTLDNAIKEVTVKGFRKGKAPREMAVSYVDPDKITQKALSTLLPKKLEAELLKEKDSSKRSRIILIEEPHYEMVEKDNKDGSIEFSVTCVLYPEVNVESVDNLKVSKPEVKTVNEQAVNEFIIRLYKNYQKMQQKTSAEESKDVQEPEPKFDEVIANEEFLKIMNVKDSEELQIRAREELEANEKYNADLEFENDLVQKIQSSVEIDIPEVMIQREVDRLKNELKQQLQKIGARIEDYIASRQKSEEEVATEMVDQATKNISLMLILTELVQKWNIQISAEELNEIKKSGTVDQQQTLELMLKQRKALEEAKNKLQHK